MIQYGTLNKPRNYLVVCMLITFFFFGQMEIIEELWDSIKDHRMIFQKVSRNFTTCTNFTKAVIPLEPIKSDDTEQSIKCMSFGKLFDFDFNTEVLSADIVEILANNTTPWTKPNKKTYEKDVMVKVAQQLFVPLIGEVVFEPDYKDHVKGIAGLTTDMIGIGSKETFHGTLDARVNGTLCLFVPGDDDDDDDDEEEETSSGFGSNGKDQQLVSIFFTILFLASSVPTESVSSAPAPPMWTYIEGKRAIGPEHIHKLVATAITSSFVLHNISESQNLGYNSLSPTLLINHDKFYVCLFDCVKDILIISEPMVLTELRDSRKYLARRAMLAIWIIVNHRYVIMVHCNVELQLKL